MATVNETIEEIKTFQDDGHIVVWTPLTTTNADGRTISMVGSSDRSAQIAGTFGVGGTVVLEGSNNGTTFHTLTDPQGNALSFTAAGLEQITELTRHIRPRVTAGDGTTSITVTVLLRRQFK
jgi:polygalacturonase